MIRNYYTLRLPHRYSDPGLDGALVSIWLEIELAYALAASTLSALKAFMESFDSGFGLGFTRGKGDSYGMSDVSGSSGQSNKNEKTASAATKSDNRQSFTPPAVHDIAAQDDISPPPPTAQRSNASPLRLRPERSLAYRANVTSEPFADMSQWRTASSNDSESSGDEMVIHHDRAYDVQHDEAPMLPVPDRRA
jgi:hypothetical protein